MHQLKDKDCWSGPKIKTQLYVASRIHFKYKGLGRSSGEGKGYPLPYSGVENSMDCIVSPWGRKEWDVAKKTSQRDG